MGSFFNVMCCLFLVCAPLATKVTSYCIIPNTIYVNAQLICFNLIKYVFKPV